MADLIEVLRALGAGSADDCVMAFVEDPSNREWLTQAADEIERLRAEVKRLDDGWTDCVWHLQSAHKAMGVWKPALVAAEADRDRLRAALASVVKHWREFGPEHGFDETLERAALAGGAEPPVPEGFVTVEEAAKQRPKGRRELAESLSGTLAAIERDALPASASPNIAESNDRADAAPLDEGPWYVVNDKVSGYAVGVGSDDFKRDVLLRVDGDFGCGVEKTDYCTWLARTLNQLGGRAHCPHCGQWHDPKLGC